MKICVKININEQGSDTGTQHFEFEDQGLLQQDSGLPQNISGPPQNYQDLLQMSHRSFIKLDPDPR